MREIIDHFIDTYKIDVKNVSFAGKTQQAFEDPKLSKTFFNFHGGLARMRVVGPTAFAKRMKRSCSEVPLARDSTGV
jgi:hypothetical protein